MQGKSGRERERTIFNFIFFMNKTKVPFPGSVPVSKATYCKQINLSYVIM